ncbi:MAG TPA: dephospho-CoA kinase [Limnochordales bacterium]
MGAGPPACPYVLGVTGGFASGKSVVTAMLARLGAAVLDADRVVRELSVPGGPVWQAIRQAFGEQVLDERGEIRRAQLRRQIFADPQARRRLDAATHPIVLEELRRRLARLRHSGAPVIVVEIPLLYEVGEAARALVDGVLVVWADAETCRRRALARGLSPQEARQAIEAQLPLEAKRQQADFVVDNSGGLDETRRQVEAIWGLLVSRAHRPRCP